MIMAYERAVDVYNNVIDTRQYELYDYGLLDITHVFHIGPCRCLLVKCFQCLNPADQNFANILCTKVMMFHVTSALFRLLVPRTVEIKYTRYELITIWDWQVQHNCMNNLEADTSDKRNEYANGKNYTIDWNSGKTMH